MLGKFHNHESGKLIINNATEPWEQSKTEAVVHTGSLLGAGGGEGRGGKGITLPPTAPSAAPDSTTPNNVQNEKIWSCCPTETSRYIILIATPISPSGPLSYKDFESLPLEQHQHQT